MKESEYINATDLAKLRAAHSILGDVFPAPSERRVKIFGLLNDWIDETYKKVDVEEDEESK